MQVSEVKRGSSQCGGLGGIQIHTGDLTITVCPSNGFYRDTSAPAPDRVPTPVLVPQGDPRMKWKRLEACVEQTKTMTGAPWTIPFQKWFNAWNQASKKITVTPESSMPIEALWGIFIGKAFDDLHATPLSDQDKAGILLWLDKCLKG